MYPSFYMYTPFISWCSEYVIAHHIQWCSVKHRFNSRDLAPKVFRVHSDLEMVFRRNTSLQKKNDVMCVNIVQIYIIDILILIYLHISFSNMCIHIKLNTTICLYYPNIYIYIYTYMYIYIYTLYISKYTHCSPQILVPSLASPGSKAFTGPPSATTPKPVRSCAPPEPPFGSSKIWGAAALGWQSETMGQLAWWKMVVKWLKLVIYMNFPSGKLSIVGYISWKFMKYSQLEFFGL